MGGVTASTSSSPVRMR